MIGRQLGRYRVIERLGAGGMGEVYRARDGDLGRDIAVKVLRPEVASDPDRILRFEQEARTASALNHPNIVTIYEVGRADEARYIAMELVRGQTLRALLGTRPLLTRRALDLAVQATEGLAKAHAAGIVHRDLKPENIMITDDGLVKILDFGLAKLASSKEGLDTEGETAGVSHPGLILGTAAYMSPEQADGRSVDYRSDQFACGAILYEMATGKSAFQRRSAVQTLAAIIEADPEPITVLNPDCPPAFRWIVERCLAKNPADRYASTLDLARELRNVRDRLAEASSPLSGVRPAPTAPAWRALSRPLLAVLALMLLTAAAAMVARGWRGSSGIVETSGPGEAVVAVPPLANLGGPKEDDYVAMGIAEVLTTSLARAPGLTLIAPSATRAYADGKRDIAKMARELGASLVVDGSLQRTGDRLRATVAIVQASSQRVLWSDAIEAAAGDVPSLQRRLAERVATALALTLSSEDKKRLGSVPTQSVLALADYAQARAFLERPDVKENVTRSITIFERALARDPRFALAHAGLGEAYWERYKATRDSAWTTKATESILEALRLDPDEPQVRIALAVAYQGSGRAEAAADELQRAIQLQPGGDDAHRLLGEVLAEQGQTEDALAELRRAIALRPNYWRNHSSLGNVYFRKGRYDEAIAAFLRVTELQPDNARGFQMLGTAHQAKGELDQALASYESAIRITPLASAYSNMGTIHYGAGLYEKAAQAYEKAIALDPTSPARHRNLGDAYRRLGQAEKARQGYARARELTLAMLSVNPKDARALGMVAVYEAKLGRFAEAIRHAAEAVALRPTDGEVLYRQAVVQALAGHFPEAIAALQRALRHGYSATVAKGDEDLAGLRSRPEYDKVLSTAS